MPSSLREAPVGADDPMPREVIVRRRENATHKARRVRIDVAISADETGRYGAYPGDDTRNSRVDTGGVRKSIAARTGPATCSPHDPGRTIPRISPQIRL